MPLLETIDRTLAKTDTKETSNNSISVKEIEEAMRMRYFDNSHFILGVVEELETTERTNSLVSTFEKNICQMYKQALQRRDAPLTDSAAKKNNYIITTFEQLANNQINKTLRTQFAILDKTEKYGEATEKVKQTKQALRDAGYFPKGELDGYATKGFNEAVITFKQDRDNTHRKVMGTNPENRKDATPLYGANSEFTFKTPYKAAVTNDFTKILQLYNDKRNDLRNPINHYHRDNGQKSPIQVQGPGSYAEQRRAELTNPGIQPGEDIQFPRYSKERQEANILSFTQDWRFFHGSYEDKQTLLQEWHTRIFKLPQGSQEQKQEFYGQILRRMMCTKENKPSIFAIKGRAKTEKDKLPQRIKNVRKEIDIAYDIWKKEEKQVSYFDLSPKIKFEKVKQACNERIVLLDESRGHLDDIIGLPDNVGQGSFLSGLQDTELPDYLPFLGRIHSAFESREREAIMRKEEKTPEDMIFLQSYAGLQQTRNFDFSFWHDLGTFAPNAVALTGEIIVTSGFALEAGLMSRSSNMVHQAAVMTGLNAPLVAEKTIEAAESKIDITRSEDGTLNFDNIRYGNSRGKAFAVGLFQSFGENLIGGIAKNLAKPAWSWLKKSSIPTETIEKYLCQGALQHTVSKWIEKTPLRGKALQDFITEKIKDLGPEKVMSDALKNVMKTSFATLLSTIDPSHSNKAATKENESGFLAMCLSTLYGEAANRVPKSRGKYAKGAIKSSEQQFTARQDIQAGFQISAYNNETQQQIIIEVPIDLIAALDPKTLTPETLPFLLKKYGIQEGSTDAAIITSYFLTQLQTKTT